MKKISDYPFHIKVKVRNNQILQGNKVNSTLLLDDSRVVGNFDWDMSEEGEEFWEDVFANRNKETTQTLEEIMNEINNL
jgi:hypothetical protein